MKRSYVQVYTGNGKGKTTAAFGLALRAAGRGLSVKIVQFLKGRDTGEISAISGMGNIELKRVSCSGKFFYAMSDEEKKQMRTGVLEILPVIESWLGKADLLILDEALPALNCGILKTDELMSIINHRGGTELVLTGRDAPEEIIRAADLVTEMREVKHYYNAGAAAREGIEF